MPEFLGRKFIGLPVWAWAIGGIALVVGIWYFSRSKASATSQTGNTAGTVAPLPYPTSNQVSTANPQSQQPGTLRQLATFHFGWPPAGAKYVWRMTQVGKQWFKEHTGQDWTEGPLPGWVDPSTIFGPNPPAYSFEVTELDPGTNYSDYGFQNNPIVTPGSQFGASVQPPLSMAS